MEVLIVEDDPVISQNIKEALITEGYTVEVAYDGLVAEKIIQKKNFNCIILDINLPYKNGYEICKSFRQFNTITPVLLLTAFEELEDKVQGFDSGADDYLTKPFYMKELILRIKSLTKRNNTTSQPVDDTIHVEDIIINKKTKTVKRNDIKIELTPREYQILSKLVSAKGELVSKQELIKEIWGSAFDANTNTIEVYINFLRNKIDKPFSKHLIKTKVGYGYYLDLEK